MKTDHPQQMTLDGKKTRPKKVAWFSAGVSSFCAAWLPKPDEIIYTHIEDQHPDSMRFLHDCEELLEKEIKILQSPYKDVETAIRMDGHMRFPRGAPCTSMLKRRVRKKWESEQKEPLIYVWGLDVEEQKRADAIIDANPKQEHEFPLIDKQMTKADCHGLAARMGLKRPVMYDLGYNNNNCIGCVKGGMGYWNKIRADFPEVFAKRAALERMIGNTCLKGGIYLDELDPDRGRMSEEISVECGIFCELALSDLEAAL